MRLKQRSSWYLLSTLVAGLVMFGLVLPGCGPQKKDEKDKKAAAQKKDKAESKPEAQKEEPKKQEPKEEPADEPKPPQKQEPKAEPKEEPKVEVKKEEPKAEPKEEPKKEEPKPEPKEEPKKEEAKPEAPKTTGSTEAPKVSTFAPAEDLARQMDKYIADLEKGIVTPEDFKDMGEGRVAKDGSAMVLMAVALGLSDQDNKYKANAAAVMETAQKLVDAKDYDSTKKALADVQAAVKGDVKSTAELNWGKKTKLVYLMEKVPLINSNLQSNVKKLEKKANDAAANAACIAVIAQGSMANVDETEKPAEAAKWYEFCAQMRDAAGAVNTGVRAKDQKAIDEAMTKLQKSCEDCHAVFHQKKK